MQGGDKRYFLEEISGFISKRELMNICLSGIYTSCNMGNESKDPRARDFFYFLFYKQEQGIGLNKKQFSIFLLTQCKKLNCSKD